MTNPKVGDEEKERVKRLMKGFPDGTAEAYFTFIDTKDEEPLKKLVRCLLEFYLPDSVPESLEALPDETELAATGIDSLGLTEMVFQIEDIFEISISDEETGEINTLKDLNTLLRKKLENQNSKDQSV